MRPTAFAGHLRNDPALLEPRELSALIRTIRMQTEPKRTAIYAHLPSPERGFTVHGQPLPNLPGSVRAVFASKREGPAPVIRNEMVGCRPDRLGRRGNAVPPVYRGQGCRAVVIVSLSRLGFARLIDYEERNGSSCFTGLGTPVSLLDPSQAVVIGAHAWPVSSCRPRLPRSKPGARRARRRLPNATVTAWSFPRMAAFGWATRSRHWRAWPPNASGTWLRGRDGVLYAATGDLGKVYRREPRENAPWSVAFDSDDTQVLVAGRAVRWRPSTPGPVRPARSST